MDLSVVVVSWNVQELLAGCLASVYASLTSSGIAYEVVVVDNASADGSAAMVRERFPQAQLLCNDKNRGYAGGSNQGLALTQGRCVVVLNPDTLVHGNALGTLLRWMDETPSAGMAGPRLVYSDGQFQHSAFAFPTLVQVFLDFFPLHGRLLESRLNGRYPRAWYAAGRPFPVGHSLGACMMVRREVLQQVGGMDEGFFMYCEELDWAMRIHRAGWGVYCVPAAELVHYAGQSTQQVRSEMFVALWRSRFRFFVKHYSPLFNRVVPWVVRLGLGAEERRARAAGLPAQELAARLDMYRRVRELSYARAPGGTDVPTTNAGTPVGSAHTSVPGCVEVPTTNGGGTDVPTTNAAGADVPQLAAVVLTKNEEHNITDCLRSVSWADKVCVLDSGSTDRTAELARQAGAEVQQRPFVNYADQRDAALQMFAAQWILFVDADERATPELAAEVRHVIQEESAVGWWVPRRNYIWGRWIRHAGWYPDYQLRLLKRGFARYDPTREVHEIVQLDGPEGHLQNPLTHYNYATVGQFLHKQDFYATYEAGVLVKQGIHPRPHSLILQPLREFRRRYITLQGYKDGGHGLLLSVLMAHYTFVAYWRARGMWTARREPCQERRAQ